MTTPSRGQPLPPIDFPESLPVSARREEIAAALRDSPVVIVCGETGSGKTTQLPKIALALGRGRGRAQGGGLIGHTQPRRIAASSVAKRIAAELGTAERTIKWHRQHIMQKLQLDSLAELVSLAERLGLVDDRNPDSH